jgi:hypothetical protein
MWAILGQILKYGGSGAGLLALFFIARWQYKTAQAKEREDKYTAERGLAPNPERCGQHEARLDAMERDFAALRLEYREGHDRVLESLSDLKAKVAVCVAKLNRSE